jgi:pimeloyl-ACP methyl ester carboxylesterase
VGKTAAVQRHRPIDESFRTIGDVRTRVLEIGGSGTPLICLHGYSDHADTWRPLMRSLRSSGRHVVAVDLPGFGKAAPLQPGPVLPQLDAFVADVVRSVAEAAGHSVVVIGNSLGGVEALRVGANPDLPIAGIVPISPAGFGHSRAIKFAERHDGFLPWIQRGVLPMPVVRGAMAVAFRRASCGSPRNADREAVRAYAQQFRTRADMIRVFGSATMVLEEIRLSPDAPAVKVPVLLLWGDRDRLTLHHGASRVRAAIPHTELVILHGHGHCPQLEAAPRIAQLINAFVDRQTSAHLHTGAEPIVASSSAEPGELS